MDMLAFAGQCSLQGSCLVSYKSKDSMKDVLYYCNVCTEDRLFKIGPWRLDRHLAWRPEGLALDDFTVYCSHRHSARVSHKPVLRARYTLIQLLLLLL